MVHLQPEGSATFLTVRQDSENHTFFIWKDNQLKEEENCAHLNWGESMLKGNLGDLPNESKVFLSTFGENSNKNMTLKHFSRGNETKKNLLMNSSNLKYLNSLAKDVYSEPLLIIHATDFHIEYLFVSRPIDMAYMTLNSKIYDI